MTDFALGKFFFRTDTGGHRVLVRQEAEIVGWDAGWQPHRELRRSEDRFLVFLRDFAAGAESREDYFIEARELLPEEDVARPLQPIPDIAPFTAASYTFGGGRWASSAMTFVRGTTGPSSGDGSISAALAAWGSAPCTNISLSFGGQSSANEGLTGVFDGTNSILFERDFGAPPISCGSNSYNGTLGIGGISAVSGTNTVGSETFNTIIEGDVEMNLGVAMCAFWPVRATSAAPSLTRLATPSDFVTLTEMPRFPARKGRVQVRRWSVPIQRS